MVRALAAAPRFAGSEAESGAREYCAEALRSCGFVVREERFEFSEFPSRWAPALMSLVIALVAMGVGHAAVVTRDTVGPMIGAVAVFASIVVSGRYLARRGVLDFPLSRSSSANLVATPGPGDPAIWLVAHLDTKSQTIPMLLRIAAVTVFGIALGAVMLAALVVAMAGDDYPGLQDAAAAMAHHSSLAILVSSLPLVLCFIGNRSPGAVDNASGTVAVLLAADHLKARNVGILITSAEELGLAGARAFVRSREHPGIAINCDTVDDTGSFLCMRSRRPSPLLERSVRKAFQSLGIVPRGGGTRRMLPGVLADNVAFSDADWDSFTISRGNLGTLARVHTSRDRAEDIDGTGIAQASLLIAAIVEELT